MKVGTDDASRRLRFVWLGPSGWRLPVDAPFNAWGAWLLLTALLCIPAWIVLPGLLAFMLLGLPGCAAVAGMATRLLMGFVDHDRSIAHHRRALAAELHAPRPQTATTRTSTTIRTDLFDREHE